MCVCLSFESELKIALIRFLKWDRRERGEMDHFEVRKGARLATASFLALEFGASD